jgi:hypothetical protein
MSYPSNDQVFEWHMQQLRNWAMPSPVPLSESGLTGSQICSTTIETQYPLSYVYNRPSFGYYTYSAGAANTPTPSTTSLPRSQTLSDLANYGQNYTRSMTPVSVSIDDMSVFDDYETASCYPDTPTSFVSSDMTDRSGYDIYHSTAARLTPSVTSQPSTQLQSEPPSEVDALMKALQPTETTLAPEMSPPKIEASGKKHVCPYHECQKAFSQPTHLKIHLRSHTGEKPYTCSVPSCRQTFSQLGNLRTHERRHIGQRPNRKRASSDPGSRGKRYECILDSCRVRTTNSLGQPVTSGKVFTQLGNLKAHMNKFHKETLARLSDQFVSHTEDDAELKEYFSSLFKNSNKGIKGRGKGRKVEVFAVSPEPVGDMT